MNDKAQGSSQLFLLMLLMFLMLFIFGNAQISAWIALTLDSIFYPLIGFNGQYPITTLFLAGTIVVFLSSLLHNFFTDWKKMAETQDVVRAFQKEMNNARRTGNTNRVNKLMKMQPEIMRKQTQASSGMMKPMFFLFIFIVPIFMWLRYFLGNLEYFYFTVPWAQSVSLYSRPFLWQAWLLLYLIFSMVIGQLIRQGLKWISWTDWWQNIRKNIRPSFK